LKLALAKVGRGDEPVPLDQPSGVVDLAEFEQCEAQLLDAVKVPEAALPAETVAAGSQVAGEGGASLSAALVGTTQ